MPFSGSRPFLKQAAVNATTRAPRGRLAASEVHDAFASRAGALSSVTAPVLSAVRSISKGRACWAFRLMVGLVNGRTAAGVPTSVAVAAVRATGTTACSGVVARSTRPAIRATRLAVFATRGAFQGTRPAAPAPPGSRPSISVHRNARRKESNRTVGRYGPTCVSRVPCRAPCHRGESMHPRR